MSTIKIIMPEEALREFCHRWHIAELALFGSALREDFRDDSDIDLLVRFLPNAGTTLFDMVRMEDELTAMLQRKVDLVSRRGIEASRNTIRRQAILESAKVIYAT